MENLRKSKLTSSLLSVLFVFLVLAQTIGSMHRVAHGRGSLDKVAPENAHFLNALWSNHSNSSDCQSFDQSCPDLLGLSSWQLTLTQLIPVWIIISLQAQFSNFERFYSAQAPPVSLK
jgi:hypothetical protein